MAKLNEMVKEFRLSINQSVDALAMMLQVSVEEYEALEKDWSPPDDFLKQMCTLFEWNYNEIRQLALSSPASSLRNKKQPASPPSAPLNVSGGQASFFHDMLRDARNAVGQTPEGMAILLDISEDYYLSFEHDTVPPDELVRKICSMLGWNYRDVRQQLINKATPKIMPRQRPLSLKDLRSQTRPPQSAPQTPISQDWDVSDTLGHRLQHAREEMGQTVSGISLVLDVSDDYYLQLENGLIPDPELLKKISALFRWNFNELQLLVHNENIQQFQPTITALDSTNTLQLNKLKKIQEDIQTEFAKMNGTQQDMLISQMEVLRDTAKRWSNTPKGSTRL